MSGAPSDSAYPWTSPDLGSPIEPTNHDVLSGRGVNIAQHPGNLRFRTLVNSRYDPNYCEHYKASEKEAVANEIIDYIRSLDPPGRFLKRPGKSKNSRGLEGPWEELTEQECLKKTRQALRDCNRQDRSGYAATVEAPQDVKDNEHVRLQSGLSNKQQAEKAAAVSHKVNRDSDSEGGTGVKRPPNLEVSVQSNSLASAEVDSPWLKKQRLDPDCMLTMQDTTTPITAASTGGVLGETSLLDSGSSNDSGVSQRPHPGQQSGFFDDQNVPLSLNAGPFGHTMPFQNDFHSSEDLPDKLSSDLYPFGSLTTSAIGSNCDNYDDSQYFVGSDHDFSTDLPLQEHQNQHNGDYALDRFDKCFER